MKNVIAVVVSYNPDVKALFRLCKLLEKQVREIVIVDNGSASHIEKALLGVRGDAYLIRLSENKGVASAQNIGIAYAKKKLADYVIMFDQDSLPSPDMVKRLVEVFKRKTESGVQVAGVGPRYLDARQNNPPPFIRISGLRLERLSCSSAESVVEVDYLISSGCLISVSALEKIGGMRDELFIDYIDIEWGLRAGRKGYHLFGVCGASMEHDLGDEPIWVAGRNFPARSPLRHYYLFRNAVWMYKQPWVPLNWKFVDCWRLMLKFGFYAVFTQNKLLHLRMMLRGLYHGLIGRTGKLETC